MAQKVITVVVAPSFSDVAFTEHDFPKVTQALSEGYFVKDIHHAITEGTKNRVTIVFVLQN